MREGLIKITDENNLFYDSVERLYKYRMHCPYCGKVSGCRCFDTLEEAEDFIVDGSEFRCSAKHSLMMLIDEWELKGDIGCTMKDMGKGKYDLLAPFWLRFINQTVRYYISVWRIKWYVFKYIGHISEKDAYKVLDVMDLDYDAVEGESC